MAGGRSERMRSTEGIHKALKQVAGRTLIQWNIEALLDAGFRDLVIAAGSHNPEILEFVGSKGCELAHAAGATIRCLVEETSLGTIGAAAIAARGADALLVVNVDNLTTLPLRQFVQHHWDANAALTIASHREPFRIPFGELVVENGEVVEYREKPVFPVRISSGTYIIGPSAAELIVPNRRFDITDLFLAVRARGLKIAAFDHDSKWIDINDAPSLLRAESLFASGNNP